MGGSYESIYPISSAILRASAGSRPLLNINSIVFVVNIVITPILVYAYGVLGAAASYSCTVLLQGVLALWGIQFTGEEIGLSGNDLGMLKFSAIWCIIPFLSAVVNIVIEISLFAKVVGTLVSLGIFLLLGQASRQIEVVSILRSFKRLLLPSRD
jgi:O-antigen/teichoic acid export membrane protein